MKRQDALKESIIITGVKHIDRDIDVSDGARNLAELNSLRGIKPGLLIGPSKVGKTRLYQIAVELTKARKNK